MLTVIIPTLDSERVLVPTLAALVSGATAGLISKVIFADGGSRDETAKVADVTGCDFKPIEGTLGRRLKLAADTARAPWLMFLRPGTVPDISWPADVGRFMRQPAADERAAVFRRGTAARSVLRELLSVLSTAPRPEQSLVISKQFYAALGGHSECAHDPETEFVRRIGRRRLITLSTAALGPDT